MRKSCDVSFDVIGPPLLVPMEAVMMPEAVENLLGNALRYGCTDGGEIAVRLTFAQDRAILLVQDYGPGIPPAARNRLFDRFFRVQDDASGGCRLGLSKFESLGGITMVIVANYGRHIKWTCRGLMPLL